MKNGPFRTRREEKRKIDEVHTLREVPSLPERFVSRRTPGPQVARPSAPTSGIYSSARTVSTGSVSTGLADGPRPRLYRTENPAAESNPSPPTAGQKISGPSRS
jgi:hypothetical protein